MSEPTRPVDRRGFLRLVATAAAALPTVAVAQVAAPPAAAPPAAPAAPEHSSAEARALAEALRTRFPDRLAEEQWTSIVSDFDGDLASGRRLRSVKLRNSDEPDFTFRP
jgi:hypothetical protein